MRRSLLSGVALLAACGSSPDEKPQGPDACKLAQTELAARLGPEFDRVITGRRLGLAAPGGCALVYLQRDEELAGEVEDGGGGLAVVDQLLALSLPDGTGKSVLNLVGASTMAPGAVLLTLDGKDVDGDGTPELIVQEASGDYQGLRIFLFRGGSAEPLEVFSDLLSVKTPEGIDINARWSVGTHDNNPAIILDGAGTRKFYSWSRTEKKFLYNEAATLAARPKPVAPEAPVPEAPISMPAPIEPPAKTGKLSAAEKAAEKKAAAERAASEKADKKAAAAEKAAAEKAEKKAAAEKAAAEKAAKKKGAKVPETKEETPEAPAGLPDLGL